MYSSISLMPAGPYSLVGRLFTQNAAIRPGGQTLLRVTRALNCRQTISGGWPSSNCILTGSWLPPDMTTRVVVACCMALGPALTSPPMEQICARSWWPRITVLLVTQLRAQIGSTGGDVSAGPKAMQHATTTRVVMSGGSQEPVKMQFEEGQPPEIVCRQFKARVTRSKVCPPGRIAEFWVNNRPTREYGPAGINEIDEYISVGVRLGAIERDGAGNYTFPGEPKVKGKPAAVALLRSRPELCAAVRERIFQGAVTT